MYLFIRSLRTSAANPATAVGWAAEMTQKVNTVTSLGMSAWMEIFSPRVGQFHWAAMTQDLQVLEDAAAKLAADPGYLSLAETGQQLAGSSLLEDNVWDMIQAEDTGTMPDYGVVIQAASVPGSQLAAVEAAVEVAGMVKGITGVPVGVSMCLTGVFGRLQWTSFYDSLAAAEQARRALAGSAQYGKFVDSKLAPHLRGAEQFMIRKVA